MDAGILFIGLVINFVLSVVLANKAAQMGRSYAGFFLLSFVFSFLIALVVLLLSQQTTTEKTDTRLQVECPMCAEKILAAAKVCKHCGREVEPQLDAIEKAQIEDAKNDRERVEKEKGSSLVQSIAGGITLSIIAAALVVIAFVFLASSQSSDQVIATFWVLLILGLGLAVLSILEFRNWASKAKK